MGSFSDRANPRYFLPAGLILASAVMLIMGFVPWATSSIMVMFVLLFLCGWFQGMGWPPCGRTMVHWWSQKERGGIVSVWNCAHNVGGGIPPLLFMLGMAWFNDWKAALYMPALAAILVAIIAFALMRTPQSCGLPPIEEYKNDYPTDYKHQMSRVNCKRNLMKYVFLTTIMDDCDCERVRLLTATLVFWTGIQHLREVKHFAMDKSSHGLTSYMNTRVSQVRYCVVGCRIESSVVTVEPLVCSSWFW